jgi:hypothetical protein
MAYSDPWAAGVTTAANAAAAAIRQAQEEKILEQQADVLKRTYEKQIGKDALDRWERMRGPEKMAHIKAAQAASDAERAKSAENRAAQAAEDLRRTRVIQQNADIFRQAKEAREPEFTQPREITLPSGRVVVQTGPKAYTLPPAQKGVTSEIDLDEQGRPKVDLERGIYFSGGQPKAMTEAMRKQISETQAGKASLKQVEADIAAEKTRPGTRIPIVGWHVGGGPRPEKMAELERRRAPLMEQYGTPSKPKLPEAPAAPAAPTQPAAATAAAPAAGAQPTAAVPAPPAGRVTVKAPDGTIGTIPAAQLPAALQAGYSQI